MVRKIVALLALLILLNSCKTFSESCSVPKGLTIGKKYCIFADDSQQCWDSGVLLDIDNEACWLNLKDSNGATMLYNIKHIKIILEEK